VCCRNLKGFSVFGNGAAGNLHAAESQQVGECLVRIGLAFVFAADKLGECGFNGVLADGLVSVIATALGSLPLTTFAQNNGVIQMTGVASRHVGKYIAVILVLLGLFPVVGRAFTTIPSPVLGGAMVLMFGLIAIAGVRILVSHGIRRREAVIAATSVGLGLGVAFEPEVFKNLPVLFQNSISAGGITAVILNLLLPEDKTDKVVKIDTDGLEH